MPTRPKTPCSYPGCPALAVRGGKCEKHQRVERKQDRGIDDRPSPQERGYDEAWRKIRREFLKANPYCELCGDKATEPHHIKAIRDGGTHSWDNLASLCHVCHSKVTAASSGYGAKR